MAKAKGLLWLFVIAAAVCIPLLFDVRDVFSLFGKHETAVNIDIRKLKEMMNSKDIILIDVREPTELEETGEIPGAVNIPLGDIEDAFLMEPDAFESQYGIPKPKTGAKNIVFTCRSGARSLRAVRIVNEMGYKGALNFKGGFLEWAKHKL
ncbi:unnamed protein product [Dicrocoelium dendriticum]|nr:unnamed protein product [Dicrocoelium dendriticum]